MDQHPHTFLGYLNHHWAFISLVCFPAFMGYLNGAASFCNVMGWTKLSEFLGRFEKALTSFVQNSKAQNQTTQPTQPTNTGATK